MDKKSINVGHIYRNSIIVQYALSCALWLSLFGLVQCGCPRGILETQVVRMCYDSEASGTGVYIDTSGAKATDNSSGPLCFCNVTITNAKFVSVRVTAQNSTCGSRLRFSFSNKQFESDENKCVSSNGLIQIPQKEVVSVELEKIKQPYVADFCSRIMIPKCNTNEYQCNVTAQCIPTYSVCDSMPNDCQENDDESNCGNAVCSEGMIQCKDGKSCYSKAERCDNKTTCADGTDEEGCSGSTDPIVRIQCFESNRFSTKTTTTTTTTTTTPTTTSTTTTTTPTTTTSTTTPTTNPWVIAAIVGGAVILLTTSICIAFAVRRKKKRSKSKNVSTDLWISDKGEKELEPLDKVPSS